MLQRACIGTLSVNVTINKAQVGLQWLFKKLGNRNVEICQNPGRDLRKNSFYAILPYPIIYKCDSQGGYRMTVRLLIRNNHNCMKTILRSSIASHSEI